MIGLKNGAFSLCFFLGLTSLISGQVQSRHCTGEPVTTVTRWGGNERILLDYRDESMRTVQGVVVGPGEQSFPTLVQVFRRAPSDPPSRPRDQEKGIPVIACVTGDDGRFAFSLSTGEYELRMSQSEEVNVTSIFVKVKDGCHRSRKIKVYMHLGN